MIITILSFLILVAHMFDVGYTQIAIALYGMKEANPIWGGLSKRPCLFYRASTIFIIIVLTIMQVLNTPAWVYGLALAARILVLIRNYNIVQKARGKR